MRSSIRDRFTPALVGLMLTLALPLSASVNFEASGAAPGQMRFAWIHGSISAMHNTDPRIQVHRYNEHTYILRQNPAVDWESPFMYLLVGAERALLLDAGATANPDWFPLARTVDGLLERWAEANAVPVPSLVVMTTSDAPAQIDGLDQFRSRPATMVVEPNAQAVREAVGLDAWPDSTGTLDLGGRELVVLPTPGVADMALSVYDPYTDLLFTGTTFLPGRIVIRDFDAYDSSIERLRDFAQANPVKWVMGGQIDMSAVPGVDYRLRSNYRPNEHVLQLDPALLSTARDVVKLINGRQHVELLADFIIMNGVGRGHRAYGYPVYSPESLLVRRLR